MTKLLAIFLLISTASYGQTKTKENLHLSSSDKWKTLKDADYSILYPSSWALDQTGRMGMSFIVLSPRESEQDKFSENVNLVKQDLTGRNLGLDEYSAISKNQIKTFATNLTFIESKRIKDGTQEYQKLLYLADQGIFHLKFEQFYFVVGPKAYVLTFTSEQTKFEKFRETAEKILESFKISI